MEQSFASPAVGMQSSWSVPFASLTRPYYAQNDRTRWSVASVPVGSSPKLTSTSSKPLIQGQETVLATNVEISEQDTGMAFAAFQISNALNEQL